MIAPAKFRDAHPTSQSELGNEIVSAHESAPGLFSGERKYNDRSVSRDQSKEINKAKRSSSILPKRMTKNNNNECCICTVDLKASSFDRDT